MTAIRTRRRPDRPDDAIRKARERSIIPVMLSLIQTLDWNVLGWLRRTFSCGALDALMPLLTHLGDGGGIWLLAAAALLAMKK